MGKIVVEQKQSSSDGSGAEGMGVREQGLTCGWSWPHAKSMRLRSMRCKWVSMDGHGHGQAEGGGVSEGALWLEVEHIT
jgi:hypothetical protein